MVYRGRPSTGCKTCRQRKIKCDERPGGCSKCEDREFQCPGYDRAIDRLFQDETASVERRARKAKEKAILARDERDKAERTQRATARMQDAIGMPLLCPLIDRGIAFFMMHYAAGLDQPSMSSAVYNQHLSTFGFHPIVATAMTGIGLAGTANLCMDSSLKREATKWYLSALKMTNKALMKQSEATSDNTLMATVLLGVFEATSNETSFNGWLDHVSGSSSLLRIRGPAQFRTPAGRRMYLQTVGLLSMKCMGMGIALPQFVHDMNKDVRKWEDVDDPGTRFFHVHIDVIDFRAHILTHQLTDLTAIVTRALELDEDAKKIFQSKGRAWEYAVETCDEGTPGIFGQEYHIYPHLAAAQMWNWVRYIRIYIHDIIRNSLIAGFSARPPVFVGKQYMQLLDESTDILYKMQSDIFASMPQYLHDTPMVPGACDSADSSPISTTASTPTPPSTDISPSASPNSNPAFPSKWGPSATTTSSSLAHAHSGPKLFISNFLPAPSSSSTPEFRTPATVSDKLPVVRVSGGYSSVWALYIAGTTPIASPQSQAYVLATLERIATDFGINQGKVFASAMRTKMELEARGISAMAERQMEGAKWDAGWYDGLGERQKISLRNAALRGGEGGIAPVYMPRVGRHVEG